MLSDWQENIRAQLEQVSEPEEKLNDATKSNPVPHLIQKYKLNEKQSIAFQL